MRTMLLALASTLAACTHIDSHLKVDGAPFLPDTCTPSWKSGYPGVELIDAEGRRLRVAPNLDGSFRAAYFAAGASVGEPLEMCGEASVRPSAEGKPVERSFGLTGSASLMCRTKDHVIEGTIRFETCHY